MFYSMKDICDQLGLQYETLRFYCNEGLVPNVKRDEKNYRMFDERNIKWLKSLQCLKKCGMSLKGMKHYMNLCMEGRSSIPERKKILASQKEYLLDRIAEINESIEFINNKQELFDGILAGEIEYTSNLIDVRTSEKTYESTIQPYGALGNQCADSLNANNSVIKIM